MPPTQRRHAAGVIEALLEEPQRFGFFQAVRLLEKWLAAEAPNERGLARLNFRNSLSLSFPASEIESIRVHPRQRTPSDPDAAPESAPMLQQVCHETARAPGPLKASAVEQIDLTPAFMGLLGVNGTLPLFYTEMLAHRELYQKDHAARAFMDVFSHRALTLFYEAWRKHRLPMQFEADPRQRYLPLVLAIAGFGQKGLRDRLASQAGGIRDESLAYHAGTLQQRTLSARQLQQMLQHHLGVQVRIEQFVGRWYTVPEAGRFHLGLMPQGHAGRGMPNGVLGRSAMLGERVWQRDLRVRIELGPLDRRRYRHFLPCAPGATALRELLTLLGGISLEYEINLRLQKQDVQGATLDSSRPTSAVRLGWDTFLQTRPANDDRVDVRYDIHAAA